MLTNSSAKYFKGFKVGFEVLEYIVVPRKKVNELKIFLLSNLVFRVLWKKVSRNLSLLHLKRSSSISQLRCDPRGRCCFGPRGPQQSIGAALR